MNRVALIGKNSVEYVEKLVDIWNNGDCAVLIDWRTPPIIACEIMAKVKSSSCFIENDIAAKYDLLLYPDINFVKFRASSQSVGFLPQNVIKKYRLNTSNSEAVIVFSSGTTGKAKGIVLSHRALFNNSNAIFSYMNFSDSDRIYMVKSISHLSSITGEILIALRYNIPLVIAPVIVPPRFIMDVVQRFKITRITVNPTLLKLLTEDFAKGDYPKMSLREIYVNGARTDTCLAELSRRTFAPCKIYFEYGLSEAGPRVTSQKVSESQNNTVGKPIPGVAIKIVDKNGKTLSNGERGYIQVSTTGRYTCYAIGSEKNKTLYGNWINTGDLGYICNGELVVVGRSDDLIIIGAHKIYPYDVEEAVKRVGRVDECAVVAITHKDETIMCCLYVSERQLSKRIRNELDKYLILFEIPKHFIKVSEIPRTANGKISSASLKEIATSYVESISSNKQ